jgi:hypothetical protein
MARDDKKIIAAPKSSAAEKKRFLRKKTRANRRRRPRQMRTNRRLRAVRKLPARHRVIIGARAKNRFRKHIGITGTLFSQTRQRRSGNGSMDRYRCILANLSRLHARLRKRRCGAFRSIRVPSKPKGLTSLVPLSEGGRWSIQSLINRA